MNRVVFVGGFSTGQSAVEKVGLALESYFQDVELFTLSSYVKNPQIVRSAAEKATLITHSAGALALQTPGVRPDQAYLLNPPLPRSIPNLLVRAAIKTARMYAPGAGIHSFDDVRTASKFMLSTYAEMATHPIANLSQLPGISSHNSIISAIAAKQAGTNVELTWTNHDMYFMPSLIELQTTACYDIPATIFAGEHDEVMLHPEPFLANVLNS